MSQKRTETRRSPRIYESYTALARMLDMEGSEWLLKVVDLGAGGCRIRSAFELPGNSPVEVLMVTEHRTLKMLGKISHRRRTESGLVETGIEFVELGEREKEMISCLLDLEGSSRPAPDGQCPASRRKVA